MTLLKFELTPLNPRAQIESYYVTFLNVYGAIFSPFDWEDIACSLEDQYNDNKIVIGCDSAHDDHAGKYDISEFYKHSTILVWYKQLELVEEDAIIQLVFTLQSWDKTINDTEVQIFVGGVNPIKDNPKYAPNYAYPITEGMREIPVLFPRPDTDEVVFIIVRPITKPAIALLKVEGFIWE